MSLKHSFLALSIYICCLFSQDLQAQNTSLGVRGGLNIANIYDTDSDPKSHIGFLGGFYFNYQFTERSFAIEPELLFTRKGFKENVYRISYIELPVMARFNFDSDNAMHPYVKLGPYISVKVKADVPTIVIFDYVNPESPGSSFENSFTEGDINTVDYGIALGGGFDFGRIELGLRYSAGLREISDDENASARHSVLSIIMGIEF